MGSRKRLSYPAVVLPKTVLHFRRPARSKTGRRHRPTNRGVDPSKAKTARKNEKRPREWPLQIGARGRKPLHMPKVVLRGSFRVAPTDFRGVPNYSITTVRRVQGESPTSLVV